MSDPELLGSAYAPSRAMPPKVTWEDIAVWDAEVQRAVARRMHDVTVAVVGMDTDALAAAVPHGNTAAVTDVSAEALSALLDRDHQRLVILTRGDAVNTVTRVLHSHPLIRDRILGVISLGGAIQGPENKAWMDQHFQHLDFDTELNRRTLYMAVTDPGASYEDASDQCFSRSSVPPAAGHPSSRLTWVPAARGSRPGGHGTRVMGASLLLRIHPLSRCESRLFRFGRPRDGLRGARRHPRGVGQGALDAAKGSVELAIGLVGYIALFLGLMKVVEEAGGLAFMARLIRPVLVRLFPDVPPDHPAMGAMVMNIAANALGLGNAATPLASKR